MTSDQFRDHADPCVVALQRLHKRLRAAANKGLVTPTELLAVAQALAAVRGLYYARRLSPPDLDSRAERGHRKHQSEDAGADQPAE